MCVINSSDKYLLELVLGRTTLSSISHGCPLENLNQIFNMFSTNLHPNFLQLNFEFNSIVELNLVEFKFQTMYLNSIQFESN